MTTVRPRPELDILRASQDRRLEREGIPMFLALVDETGDDPPPADDVCRRRGEDVAQQLDACRAELAGAQRDGDMGVLISLLQAASYADFDQSVLGVGDD